MVVIGMTIGALAGLFIAGPLAWVFMAAVLGENNFPARMGWLGWGGICGLVLALLTGSIPVGGRNVR